MKRILLTGGTGFIGSTLVEVLNQKGVVPFIMARKTSDFLLLKGLKYEVVEGDLRNPDSLARCVENVDGVIHLAGAISGLNRGDFFQTNTVGTKILAEATAKVARSSNRKISFVCVSSLAAGGPSSLDRPRSETDPDAPVSWYGESKLEAERELLKFKDDLHITIVRPPVVYGPKDRATLLLIQTAAGKFVPVPASKSGDKLYSLIYSLDLAEKIARIALEQSRTESGSVFYVSSQVIRFRDWMTWTAEAMGKKPFLFSVPSLVLETAAYCGDWIGKIRQKPTTLNRDKIKEIRPDSWVCSQEKWEKLYEAGKPENKVQFQEGIQEALKWYKNAGWVRS